jgi:hypothetical protein
MPKNFLFSFQSHVNHLGILMFKSNEIYPLYRGSIDEYAMRGTSRRGGGERGGAIRIDGSISLSSFKSHDGGKILHPRVVTITATSARLQ